MRLTWLYKVDMGGVTFINI